MDRFEYAVGSHGFFICTILHTLRVYTNNIHTFLCHRARMRMTNLAVFYRHLKVLDSQLLYIFITILLA